MHKTPKSKSYDVYFTATSTKAEKAQGAHGSKTNHRHTSRRDDNKPKSEPVRPAKDQPGACVAAGKRQRTMHDSSGDAGTNVIPNTGTLAPPRSSAYPKK
jgi:hypothetical protein